MKTSTMTRLTRRATALAVSTLALSLAVPVTVAHAEYCSPGPAVLHAFLEDPAQPLDPGLADLLAQSRTSAVGMFCVNDLLRAVLEDPDLAARWAGELHAAAMGSSEGARQVIAALHQNVSDTAIQYMAQMMEPVVGEGTFMYVRFLLHPQMIHMLPIPPGPSVRTVQPNPDAVSDYYATPDFVSDAQNSDSGGGGQPICGKKVTAKAHDASTPSKFGIDGTLTFCYNFDEVLNPRTSKKIYTYKGFEPFMVYRLSTYYVDEGGYMSSYDSGWNWRENSGYEWAWQPNFETCAFGELGCGFNNWDPRIAVFGYYDGTTAKEEPVQKMWM